MLFRSLNYLGYSWIDQGINLDEGMKMIKRAVDQRPRSEERRVGKECIAW